MGSSDRAVTALALATAALVSMPLGVLPSEAKAETPEEARRRVLGRIPEGVPAPRVVTRVEPVEYVRICDAFGGSRSYYIPGTDTCLRVGGYVRYEVNGASTEDPVETSTPEPVEYVRICDAFGSNFYYIPGTDVCLRVGGRIRTTVYDASGYQRQANGEGYAPDAPNLFDYDFFANGSVGRTSGFRNYYLATERLGQLTLRAITYEPEGTSTGFEAGGRFTVGEFDSGFLRQGMFFKWGISHAVFNDSESLGDFNAGAGTGLGIPGTGDPAANFPAGVLLAPPNMATNIEGRFDWSATSASFTFGRELSLSPTISIAPFSGFQWTKIDERVRLSFSVPNYLTDVAYETNLDITRKSLVAGSEFNWSPGYAFGPAVLSYFFVPTFYWDCLEYSGTDQLMLTGFLNDNQSVDLSGGDGAVGGAFNVGMDIEFDNSPFEIYVGAGYERRAAGVSVVRTGQTGELSSGNVEYQSNFSFSVGGALTY